MTKLIGICGGSGSGKTTLANLLVKSLNTTADLLSMDDYYYPIEKQEIDENGVVNFDLPSALNSELFVEDLSSLKKGNTIQVKEYAFNNSNVSEQKRIIIPKDFIVCEGIFLMSDTQLRSIFDVLIFIEADENVMYQRRVARDTAERNISNELISYQWTNHFLPAYKVHVLPHKFLADNVVDGNKQFNILELQKALY